MDNTYTVVTKQDAIVMVKGDRSKVTPVYKCKKTDTIAVWVPILATSFVSTRILPVQALVIESSVPLSGAEAESTTDLIL